MSLYAQYVKEREGFETLEVEHGFATYKQVDPDMVYLRDIFVEQDFRQDGIATKLSKQVAEIAKGLGATKLTGSVCIDAAGVTISMKALLGDGFQFSHAVGNMIYFVKDI
jgi:GNAT superfamily N-acetyltransferase